MRMVRRRSGFSALAIALSLTAFSGSYAKASTLITYSTSGTIDSTGVAGAPVISFVSLTANDFTASSFFSLGSFQVAPLQAGQTTSYTHTPFHITLVVDQVNGAAPSPNETPIVLTGYLDGKITGADKSTVTARFDPISNNAKYDPVAMGISFKTGQYQNTLTIPGLKLTIVPSTTNSGLTTAEAELKTALITKPIPEPTTVALFLTTIAGLGLRKRLRAARLA
jgi:hypothetical protein